MGQKSGKDSVSIYRSWEIHRGLDSEGADGIKPIRLSNQGGKMVGFHSHGVDHCTHLWLCPRTMLTLLPFA